MSLFHKCESYLCASYTHSTIIGGIIYQSMDCSCLHRAVWRCLLESRETKIQLIINNVCARTRKGRIERKACDEVRQYRDIVSAGIRSTG